MKILIVSAEVAPFAKVGGLADVAASLPRALKSLGHDVRILMPAYGMVLRDYENEELAAFDVRMNGEWTERARVHKTDHHGVPVYLLGSESFFADVSTSSEVYTPGHKQYLFFAKALFPAIESQEWIPDAVHFNDWHTGFGPVFLKQVAGEEWRHTGSIFTIHNLAYQGEFGREVLDDAGLDQSLFNMHQVEAHGRVNFLKAGATFADRVNTVSPRYADEIQTEDYGCGLNGLMRHLFAAGKLSGILNGIDTEEFNPATDPNLKINYSADALRGKALNRRALREELGLPIDEEIPLAGVVSRLSDQKGIDLIAATAEELFSMPMQLVIQAIGDPNLAAQLRELQHRYPNSFRFEEKFDAELAQRVYAASDIFLMPSAFEPCGLGQMIALRYGAIPVVRSTGGLADTVFESQNGFVFQARSPEAFLSAARRAVETYKNKSGWERMVERGMKEDFGWTKSAVQYVHLYEAACSNGTEERRNRGTEEQRS